MDNNNIEFEFDLGPIGAETSMDIVILIEYSKDSSDPDPHFIDYEFYLGFSEDKTNEELKDLIYKRFDKVALKKDHTVENPPETEDNDKDDKDDSSGGGGRSGLNEDEKIAVGVSVTLVFLAVLGFVLWWVCIRNKGSSE